MWFNQWMNDLTSINQFQVENWDVVLVLDLSSYFGFSDPRNLPFLAYLYLVRFHTKALSTKNLIKKNTHPTVTSKIFDPTEEDTAMSPLPCWATSTLVIKSGTEVPAAKNVRPITWKIRFKKIMRIQKRLFLFVILFLFEFKCIPTF